MTSRGSGVAASGGGDTAGLARAHAQLLKDRTLQFNFDAIQPIKTPDWIIALGKFIEAILPVLKWIVWAGLAIGAVLILFFLARELIRARFPQWFRPKVLSGIGGKPVEWRPDPVRARILLDDADRLAAEGRYAEAAHILLFRTVEDIDGRRPNLVRPALTARDIAALDALPGRAKNAFNVIARVVERSFFGGRPVDADAFGECRRAYEAFIAPEAWA